MILPVLPINFSNRTNRNFKGFYDPAAGSPRTAMQEKLIQAAKEAKEKAKQILPDPNNIMHSKGDAFEHIMPDGSLVTVSLEDLTKKSSEILSDKGEVINTSTEKLASAIADNTHPAVIAGIRHILPDGITTVDIPLEPAANGAEIISDAVKDNAFPVLKGDSLLERIIKGTSDDTDAALDGVSKVIDVLGG